MTLMGILPLLRYLFNAGEGFQRYCVQHKLKLSRMMNILATRAAVDAVGGIPGDFYFCSRSCKLARQSTFVPMSHYDV